MLKYVTVEVFLVQMCSSLCTDKERRTMDDLLLIKFFEKQTTREESLYVLRWIEESVENKAYFQHLHSIWVVVQMDKAVDVDEDHIKQIMKRIDNHRYRLRNMYIKISSVAAVAILVVVGLFNWIDGNDKPVIDYELLANAVPYSHEITLTMNPEKALLAEEDKTIRLAGSEANLNYANQGQVTINDTINLEASTVLNTIRVPYGKRSVIILEDSTKVYLNSGSTLVYPSVFMGDERRVYLEGEAYFDVTHNVNRRFVVQTTFKTVEVLGTTFNVLVDKEQAYFEAVLVHGRISLDNKEEQIELSPNHCYSFNANNGESTLTLVDVSNYISWIDGKLKFKKQKISTVLKKLEKVYNIKITLLDPKYSNSNVSGELNMKDTPDETLRLLMYSILSKEDKRKNIFKISSIY